MTRIVVSPDQMPDWVEKRDNIFHEIGKQLVRGLRDPQKGLTLERLQDMVVERRTPIPGGLSAPSNGRILILPVPINESRSWDEAVKSGGPDTPPNYSVWKVGDQYPPDPLIAEPTIQDIILVNFGSGSLTVSETALAWGRREKLRQATPRGCFAIGACYPNLHRNLDLGFMAVASLKTCSFKDECHAVGVWWREAVRAADLHRFANGWLGYVWFAFLREQHFGVQPSHTL